MNRKLLVIVFALTLAGMLVPAAKADESNKEIQFSINGPVEVPGVVLSPGRYELKLVDFGTPVAEILSADGSKSYGFFDTIPVDLNHATTRARVVLVGSGKTNPKRIEEWFYPGDPEGNQFLYPNELNSQVARSGSTHQGLNR